MNDSHQSETDKRNCRPQLKKEKDSTKVTSPKEFIDGMNGNLCIMGNFSSG